MCMNRAKDCDTRSAILGKLQVICIFFSIFRKLLLSKHYFWSYSNLCIYDQKAHKLDGNPEDLYNYSICFCLFVLRFYGPVNPMGSC